MFGSFISLNYFISLNDLKPFLSLHKVNSCLSVRFFKYTEDGPPHLRRFVWTCSFNSLEAHGAGRSKKEAKVAAATELKRNLDFSSLPPIVEKKKRPNK